MKMAAPLNAERTQNRCLREVFSKSLPRGYLSYPTSGLLIRRSSVRITHGPPLRKVQVCGRYSGAAARPCSWPLLLTRSASLLVAAALFRGRYRVGVGVLPKAATLGTPAS